MIDPDLNITERRAARLRYVIERRQTDLHLVIENVHDPHNVGAVLRTCDAVGVGTVHLVYNIEELPVQYTNPHAGVWKWVERIAHQSIDECYAYLRERAVTIYATDLGDADNSTSVYTPDLTVPVAFVFGNENRGVSVEASQNADGNMLIPMMGLVQSLNISVACAVTLYEALRQRLQSGMYDGAIRDPHEVDAILSNWSQR